MRQAAVGASSRPFFSPQMAARAKRCADELVAAAIGVCEPENVGGDHAGHTQRVLTERFLKILAKHL